MSNVISTEFIRRAAVAFTAIVFFILVSAACALPVRAQEPESFEQQLSLLSATIDRISATIDELVLDGTFAYAGEGEVLGEATSTVPTVNILEPNNGGTYFMASLDLDLPVVPLNIVPLDVSWSESNIPAKAVVCVSLRPVSGSAATPVPFPQQGAQNALAGCSIVPRGGKGSTVGRRISTLFETQGLKQGAYDVVVKVQKKRGDRTILASDVSTQPITIESYGTFRLYKGSTLTVQTNTFPRHLALGHCTGLVERRPQHNYWCTWNNELLFGEKIATAPASIRVELLATEEEIAVNDGSDNDTGTFTIKYRVEAVGSDVYVSKSPKGLGRRETGIDFPEKVLYAVGRNGAATTNNISASLSFTTENGASDAGEKGVQIEEGGSSDFTLTVTRVNAGGAKDNGLFRTGLRGIGWAPAIGNQQFKIYNKNLKDYKTDVILLD